MKLLPQIDALQPRWTPPGSPRLSAPRRYLRVLPTRTRPSLFGDD